MFIVDGRVGCLEFNSSTAAKLPAKEKKESRCISTTNFIDIITHIYFQEDHINSSIEILMWPA
jgi:hypothetical protein